MATTSNRFGIAARNQAQESPDFSTSKFFVGGWADPKHEIVEEPIEPRAPVRPNSPASGRSRNASAKARSTREDLPVSGARIRRFAKEDGKPRPDNLPRNDEHPLALIPRSSSTSSAASYAVPKWPKPESKAVEHKSDKSSVQSFRLSSHGIGVLTLGKFAGCAQGCNKTPPANCFTNSCVLPPAISRPGLSSSAPQEGLQMQKLWADKHFPDSLASFPIHQEQAQSLRQLVSGGNCHNLLLYGPPGSGRRTLIKTLLREIFGPAAWMCNQEMRSFEIKKHKFRVPIVVSPHHVEANMGHIGQHFRHVLANLLKEMKQADETEVIDFKVLVLHNVEKASVEAQQHIRFLMDRYADNVKVIFCCQHANKLLESIQSRCVLVSVQAPAFEEVIQVLQYVAKEEKLVLPADFAKRIARAAGSNLRQAVMSLEACHIKEYPFKEDQTIVTGWEEDIAGIAFEILDDQSARRLFEVRGKIHRLLEDGVPAKLIHRSLVEELLKLVDGAMRIEVYRWAKFYAKKMPEGNDAIFKLEEFIAKLMSIYKKRYHHYRPER